MAEAEVRRAEAEALLRKAGARGGQRPRQERQEEAKELAKDLNWAEGHCERISNLAKETARLLMQVATRMRSRRCLGALSATVHSWMNRAPPATREGDEHTKLGFANPLD